MKVVETLNHLIVECSAYDTARVETIGEYKGILIESKPREIINSENNGLGFLLRLGSQNQNLVVDVSKPFLYEIWKIRVI